MSLYVIISSTDPDYLLIKRLISGHPTLKGGFTLKEILKDSSISLNDRRTLKKIFGGEYSTVLTHTINFEYQNGKWHTKEIDIERGFHQFIIKVLNHALKKRKYPFGSPVFTKDIGLIEFLTIKQQEVYDKEVGDTDRDENLYPMNQEMISTRLETKVGEVSHFDYGFVRVFLETLYDYEEILLLREFG